ncbi:chemotaxis protein CheW [Rhodoferax aquaticus]|uniref:Purine-binding chemotaxis protein CheW n=1 Tax=Rhodoferax aquaticus TaxID=2527691 RepID=A0A515ER35_9BURK|nr:chemotaxis protein CheW [Rhodoferax aquaticus]QDL55095.1 purine-binding chemotaxis protein CheW [Rhodoferax aquaticus]
MLSTSLVTPLHAAQLPRVFDGGRSPAASRDMLIFSCGTERYGLDLRCVQEIRRYTQPTRLFSASLDCFGVVNLRGCIVPLFDLHRVLGHQPTVLGTHSVVVVAKLQRGTVGLVVDAVDEVVTIQPHAIQSPPQGVHASTSPHILGLTELHQRLVVLLDGDRLMPNATLQ